MLLANIVNNEASINVFCEEINSEKEQQKSKKKNKKKSLTFFSNSLCQILLYVNCPQSNHNIPLLSEITLIWTVCMLNWTITAICVATVTSVPLYCSYHVIKTKTSQLCSENYIQKVIVLEFFFWDLLFPQSLAQSAIRIKEHPESEWLRDTCQPHLLQSYVRSCEYKEILGWKQHTWLTPYGAFAQ